MQRRRGRCGPRLSGRTRRLPLPPVQSHAPVPNGADEAIGQQRELDREDHRAHKQGFRCRSVSRPIGATRIGCRVRFRAGCRRSPPPGLPAGPTRSACGHLVGEPAAQAVTHGRIPGWIVRKTRRTDGRADLAVTQLDRPLWTPLNPGQRSAAVRRAWRAGLPDPG